MYCVWEFEIEKVVFKTSRLQFSNLEQIWSLIRAFVRGFLNLQIVKSSLVKRVFLKVLFPALRQIRWVSRLSICSLTWILITFGIFYGKFYEYIRVYKIFNYSRTSNYLVFQKLERLFEYFLKLYDKFYFGLDKRFITAAS